MQMLDRTLFKLFKVERSYSQAGEDRLLRFLFNKMGKASIAYLDIGTNHPLMGNNTYLFYSTGSKGVCVEPNPEMGRLIERMRPRDKYLSVGISGGERDGVAEFYSMSSHVLSTFCRDDALKLEAGGNYSIREVLKIPIMNINNIIEENFDGPIDLVSIDVEGWNEQIVRSFDFSKSRPFCFCVETLTFSDTGEGEKISGIFDVFRENNYEIYGETRVNTIFLNMDVPTKGKELIC